jgi:fructokinase
MNECDDTLVGAIEAGGTKFVCAIGSRPYNGLVSRIEFPTRADPKGLLARVVEWLEERQHALGRLRGIGIACFGPVDLEPASPTYGFITSTPKPGWDHTDVVGPLRRAFGDIPIGFDTDVNGAALGEFRWGNAAGVEDFVYITMGTGIGAGGMANGRLLRGLVHPEMGHLILPRLAGDDFEGSCPYHGACWEGLCSGPAIAKRTGIPASQVPRDHPAWHSVAHYTACAIANITYVLSPRKIVLGGSVRKAGLLGEDAFLGLVRVGVHDCLQGYIASPALSRAAMAEYIVPPILGDDAGICGAIALAHCALERSRP